MDIREYAREIKNGQFIAIPGTEEIPKMSTDSIGNLINGIVRDMPEDQCYVNVGVWHGFSLLAGMFKNPHNRCIGVDNFSIFNGPRREFRERFLKARSDNHDFYDMDYKTYFEKYHTGPIGFYFYDAAHDYHNQFLGLVLAEPYLSEGSLVMVDDTDCVEPRQATLNFMKQSPFEYEIILDESGKENQGEFPGASRGVNFKANPLWWNGIVIIKKGELKNVAIT